MTPQEVLDKLRAEAAKSTGNSNQATTGLIYNQPLQPTYPCPCCGRCPNCGHYNSQPSYQPRITCQNDYRTTGNIAVGGQAYENR